VTCSEISVQKTVGTISLFLSGVLAGFIQRPMTTVIIASKKEREIKYVLSHVVTLHKHMSRLFTLGVFQ
jgi:hypothetical protein